MHYLKMAVLVAATIALTSLTALADQNAANETRVGEKLVRQLWANMKNADMETIKKTTASGFQSVHQDGANTREQELALIKGLKLGNYTLSNIKVTRNGPVLVATYLVAVEETIEGKRLTKKPASRLSVFLETENGWQWMAHANLKSIPQ